MDPTRALQLVQNRLPARPISLPVARAAVGLLPVLAIMLALRRIRAGRVRRPKRLLSSEKRADARTSASDFPLEAAVVATRVSQIVIREDAFGRTTWIRRVETQLSTDGFFAADVRPWWRPLEMAAQFLRAALSARVMDRVGPSR